MEADSHISCTVVSVFVSASFGWTQKFLIDAIQAKWDKRTLRINGEFVGRLESVLEEAIRSPHITPQQKAKFTKQLSELQQKKVELARAVMERHLLHQCKTITGHLLVPFLLFG